MPFKFGLPSAVRAGRAAPFCADIGLVASQKNMPAAIAIDNVTAAATVAIGLLNRMLIESPSPIGSRAAAAHSFSCAEGAVPE